MASVVFSSIQSLSTKLLKAIRGTPSTLHQQDPPSPVTDQQKSVINDLEKLSRMLARIQAVQQDAEEREIHDRSVRLWLEELRGVGYQAEDVLDEFYYEGLRSIVESGDAAIEAYHRDGGTKGKIAEMYASSSLDSYSVTNTKASIPDGMAKKIKAITERFEEISNARRDLHLREEDGTRLVIGPQIQLPTSSHVDERAIFGREEDKEEIISLLNPSTGPDFMVLPIVGMGGFGKTTLAQLVFNDSRIDGLFNKRCWVSVSDDFDLVRLTKAIIDLLSQKPCEFFELNKLQDVLKEKISGHGLFLVLDDVWNEQRNLWECFRVGFLGAKFVRILTTTRNTSVAKIMQTTSPFQLSSLPEENCWSLFKHFAFGSRETSENANLHEIGHGIVKKCKGSPLAIKALGGILRYYEMDEEKWREILESDISEIDDTGEVMPALRLSYRKLPQHLKPCFLYLSMFPKDKPFEKDILVRLWMAQGYINGNTRNLKTLEEIGSEYFDELQGRSLVDDGPWGYILHDLIHDLARSVSQEAYRPVLENDQEYNDPHKVCHLYFTKQDELLGLVPSNYMSIRTFVKEFWSEKFDLPIFSEIACARALHLWDCSFPNTLGTLKHLRYLFVTSSKMLVLPKTLCLLYNLQTLILICCFLEELPENMKNLINLQYFRLDSIKIQHLPESIFPLPNLHTLLLSYCYNLKEFPMGIEQSNRLHILDLPRSCTNMPSGILRVLKDMNKLKGSLCISGLKNIVDVELCRNTNLASKPNLRRLILNFEESCIKDKFTDNKTLHLHLTDHSSNNTKSENDENIHNVVLESLQPHGNLTALEILNYGGRNFPSWLLNPLLPKLTALTLNFCTEPNYLPPFGQLPYLRFLKIFGSTGDRNVGDELSTYSLLAEYGSSKQPKEPSYPSLEVLSLKMLNFVEWQAHDGDFPRLKELTIEYCPNMWKIPVIELSYPSLEVLSLKHMLNFVEWQAHDGDFPRLKELTIEYCPNLWKIPVIEPSYPSLEVLSLKHMLNFVEWQAHDGDFPRLKELTIEYCPNLWKIPVIPQEVEEVTFKCCPKLELPTFPSLVKKLRINECGFREIIFQSVTENLTISNCVELTSINWMDGSLDSHREVCFEYCPKVKLVSIPVGTLKLKIHECGFRKIIFQSIPENLTITNCVELSSINWSDDGLNFVGEVTFGCCPKLELVTIPVGTLKLKIHKCGFREIIFQSVPKKLTISNCVELNSIKSMDGSLDSIREVSFICCPNLELQFPMKDVLHSSTMKIKINDCPRIDVSKLNIYQRNSEIKELTLFGNNGIRLPSVDSKTPLLEIPFTLFLTKEDFQEVESLTCAPSVEVGCQSIMLNLPSLVILEISRCRTVVSVTGLDNLSNLKRLSISYCPELCNWRDKTLPLSLKFLELDSCDKLSSLPMLSVQNHSSILKVLVIIKCPRLTVLEGFHGLLRLKTVDIRHCRNISISPSTESLQFGPRIAIGDCPLMRAWCQSNNITYHQLNGNPQDDREAEQESGDQESTEPKSGEHLKLIGNPQDDREAEQESGDQESTEPKSGEHLKLIGNPQDDREAEQESGNQESGEHLQLIGNPQDDREAEQEGGNQESTEPKSGEHLKLIGNPQDDREAEQEIVEQLIGNPQYDGEAEQENVDQESAESKSGEHLQFMGNPQDDRESEQKCGEQESEKKKRKRRDDFEGESRHLCRRLND